MAKKGYWIVLRVSAADGAVMAEYAKFARPVIDATGWRLIISANPATRYAQAISLN
jgi:hypothetical protein